MNPLYLQFVFAMVLVINGIMCQSDQGMLKCEYHGNGERTNFTVAAKYSPQVLQNVSLVVNANITCGASDTLERERQSDGASRKEFKLSCPTHTPYETVLVSFNYDLPMDKEGHLTIICWEFCGNPFNVVNVVDRQLNPMKASCSRGRKHNTLRVTLFAPGNVKIRGLNTIVFAPDPPVGSTSVKSNTVSIVVPTVVVLVAVFLLVALVATIWCKRRNKQTSALNIRSTVNQNEDTVVYNEIGEQDYNTLFGGKERDDYHEYNVPDHPQGKISVDRTTVSGSGPYQELSQDETRAVAAVNMSPGVTGPKHGVADNLHAYQDLRQDDRSVSGSHPNGEMPNQLPSQDTPATENGYQALKTATPDYATLEPSPEYATLEQNDQSVKGTSDVSGPPPDKEYDTLQRSINTVGQPPSAGYGTLKPMNGTDADYESPDGQPKTTSDFEDPTRPT